jgi:hypothetical protein
MSQDSVLLEIKRPVRFQHLISPPLIEFLQTGRSKHYGFIEFDSSSVAEIVSETMNNYLLAGHLLQCKLIATERLHPDLWVGSNKKWKFIPKGRIARLAHNKVGTCSIFCLDRGANNVDEM